MVQRVKPPQPWKPGEVHVGTHPLGPVLDGECRVVRIGYEFVARGDPVAKLRENRPMALGRA